MACRLEYVKHKAFVSSTFLEIASQCDSLLRVSPSSDSASAEVDSQSIQISKPNISNFTLRDNQSNRKPTVSLFKLETEQHAGHFGMLLRHLVEVTLSFESLQVLHTVLSQREAHFGVLNDELFTR